MEKLSRITWDQTLSVHIEVLDEQHRKLFDIVNSIIDVYEKGSNDFLPAIHDLIAYLATHFHQEHLVMMRANYHGFTHHSEQHQQFTKKMSEFLKDYQGKDPDLGLKMVMYLKDWIRDHTTTMDQQYGEYLLLHPEK